MSIPFGVSADSAEFLPGPISYSAEYPTFEKVMRNYVLECLATSRRSLVLVISALSNGGQPYAALNINQLETESEPLRLPGKERFEVGPVTMMKVPGSSEDEAFMMLMQGVFEREAAGADSASAGTDKDLPLVWFISLRVKDLDKFLKASTAQVEVDERLGEYCLKSVILYSDAHTSPPDMKQASALWTWLKSRVFEPYALPGKLFRAFTIRAAVRPSDDLPVFLPGRTLS